MELTNGIGSVLLATASLVVAANLTGLIAARVRGRPVALLPFVGGAAGALGVWLSWVPDRWMWLPLVVDFTVWWIPVARLLRARQVRDARDRP